MRNSGLCKIACSLAALILVATSASCGTSANVTNTPNNSSKYKGTITASQAFNTPSIWYKVHEEDGGILSGNAEITRVFSIDSEEKVTEYNTTILSTCKDEDKDVTLASMQDTSSQELIDTLKKAEEDLPDLCKVYFKKPFDSHQETCDKQMKTFGEMDEDCKLTYEEYYSEEYSKQPKNDRAHSAELSLTVDVDALGKRTEEEWLYIKPGPDAVYKRTDGYELLSMAPMTISSKTYGGYCIDDDGEYYLVTEVEGDVTFTFDSPDAEGVNVR